MQATGVLVAINLLFILMVFQLQHIGSMLLLLLVVGSAVVMTYFLHISVLSRKKTADAWAFIQVFVLNR